MKSWSHIQWCWRLMSGSCSTDTCWWTERQTVTRRRRARWEWHQICTATDFTLHLSWTRIQTHNHIHRDFSLCISSIVCFTRNLIWITSHNYNKLYFSSICLHQLMKKRHWWQTMNDEMIKTNTFGCKVFERRMTDCVFIYLRGTMHINEQNIYICKIIAKTNFELFSHCLPHTATHQQPQINS